MRHQPAVGVDALLDVCEVAALDDAVKPLGPADQHAGLAARQRVGHQLPRRLVAGRAVEQLDITGGMRQQQLDGLGFGRVVGVVDEPPETRLAQRGLRRTRRTRSAARTGPPRSDSRRRRATPRSAGRTGSHRALRVLHPRRAIPPPAVAAPAAHRTGSRPRGGWRCRPAPEDRRIPGCCAPPWSWPVRLPPRPPRRPRSRLVSDEAIQRVQREPRDDHDGRDEHDLEQQHHASESSRRAPTALGGRR